VSESFNKIDEKDNCFIKTYGKKKPFWKYFLRTNLHTIGLRQPIEYYNEKQRLSFEKKTLLLWERYGFNVPKVIDEGDNHLVLSKINGKTFQDLSNNKNLSLETLKTLFIELNYRHNLALKNHEKHLAHIDANLRNMLLFENKIYHIDFEMGREYENEEKWLERELSKLLISILEYQEENVRKEILKLFLEIYTHKQILKNLFLSKINSNRYFIPAKAISKKYSLKKIIFEIQTFFSREFLDIMLPNQKNILIIYSARFGDILMSTPTLRAIKETWGNSKITFLTHPQRKEILDNNPFISTLGSISKSKIFFTKFSIKKKYDLAFVINKDSKKFTQYAINKAKYTIAFSTCIKNIDEKLFYHLPYPKQHSKHSADMRLSLLSPLKIIPSSKRLDYFLTEEETIWAKSYLNDLKNKFLIGIQANSFHTKAYRNWPIKNFLALCQKILQERENIHFLLLGSQDDITNIMPLYNSLKTNASMFAGKFTLRQSSALMSLLNLYIGVDTGPTHIMGTFNKNMIVLYHSFSSSDLLKPLENPHFIAIDHPPKLENETGYHNEDISVEQVFKQVKKFL